MAEKPGNLNRTRYEAGELEDVFYQPGVGLAPGLTVGLSPQDINGYGRVMVAVNVPWSSIRPSPEAADLGNKTTGHALAVNDAYVHGDIATSNIRIFPNPQDDVRYWAIPYFREDLPKKDRKKGLKYSDDQARDDNGRFAEGGGSSAPTTSNAADAPGILVYHTAPENAAKSILKDGLKTGGEWSVHDKDGNVIAERPRSVYFTDSMDRAKKYADILPATFADHAIVEFTIPASWRSDVKVDERDNNKPAFTDHTFRIERDIPAKYIQAVYTKDYQGKYNATRKDDETTYYAFVFIDESKGAKYSDDQPRDDHGRFSDTGAGGSSRSERASASHVPMTKERRAVATKHETKVATMIGGTKSDDNKPFDVNVGVHAVEVKTIIKGKNPKVTLHPESLARKEKEAKANKWKTSVVVIDARSATPVYYWKEGLGSFRLSSMTKVTTAELKAKYK